MTEVFLGQIMLTGFQFAPKGFALCNGQLLPIAQNQALFSLLGTFYGGNGTTNFALPDLRGRAQAGYGNSVDPGWQPSPYSIGETGGVENVTLVLPQLPAHNHQCFGTTANGTVRNPTDALYGTNSVMTYAPSNGPQVPVQGLGTAGNTQAHPNMQPFQVISYSIALSGIYPSRN